MKALKSIFLFLALITPISVAHATEGLDPCMNAFAYPAEPPFSLLTPRLQLHPLESADAPALIDILSRPESRSYTLEGTSLPEGELNAFVRSHHGEPFATPLSTRVNVAIYARESGKVIGAIGFDIFAESKSAGIGYVIAPEYQSRGLATEALNAVLSTLSSRYDLDFFFAAVNEKNTASARVLEKLGFQRYLPVEGYPGVYYHTKPLK